MDADAPEPPDPPDPSDPATAADAGVGARLRRMRQIFGLTQRELARRAGVTNGAISLIEQGRVSPSISSLKKILDGIPMSLAEFFTLDLTAPEDVFFTAADLTEIAFDERISFRMVGRRLKDRALQMLHETYSPGADTGEAMLRHEGEEAGVIIRGRIVVTVGDQERTLGAGEAYYFRSRIPHRFRNPFDEVCEVISANTPPSF
ncbi:MULTISPECIES: cupin domain-containing protein [Acidiphilium]|jgi:transcriptional regulator with XRE-family HTH domain|uniref:Xre family transcriptional regulator n=3 Tax=Acidiphilium TaxID=522 RepID=F0J3V9_ACIMA|nr:MULTISPECIES: cupin domain-containing protein [Acidiphilium]MDE2326583.1 cupin domain-containing protein [Rhodospirillales bacterium]ABQ29768.1 putative transcriptional regulator, XRE family [Acidiphilium cryptum JF-5]EGO96959.1 XRE family transcriptional regulator [Acidiphilium sp. PM]KDM67594.1 HTH-type transcriptional regulator PuuR [Acidiphilium sp. JA12-A1]MBS3024737.1 cupin domain-containing protein [Acidiphilium multivorum]